MFLLFAHFLIGWSVANSAVSCSEQTHCVLGACHSEWVIIVALRSVVEYIYWNGVQCNSSLDSHSEQTHCVLGACHSEWVIIVALRSVVEYIYWSGVQCNSSLDSHIIILRACACVRACVRVCVYVCASPCSYFVSRWRSVLCFPLCFFLCCHLKNIGFHANCSLMNINRLFHLSFRFGFSSSNIVICYFDR